MEKEKKNKKVTNNKKKYKNKSKLDIHFKLILNVILIAILFFGSIYMFIMASNIDIHNKEVLISYNEKSDINYTVSLKPNQYYPTTNLGMNQQYPSALIDKINIKFNYNFNTSKESNYKYRYFATTTLVADNKTNNGTNLNNPNDNLLTRTYQLENEVSGSNSYVKEFNLEKEYTIDYTYFNTYITNYKNTYILSLDSYLKVSMYVEIIDTYQDKIINTSKTMEVSIPLITNPVGITTNNPTDLNKSIYKESDTVASSTFFLVLASIMFISSILLFSQELRKVIKSDKEQSKYISKLNKIMSTNSEVIVKVKNNINLKNNNIIEVETIEALLDAQNELRIPIAYFETKRNKEGCFVIVNGKEAWRYILKSEDEK